MKNIMSLAITLLLTTGIANSATPVTEEKTWTETYAVGTSAPLLEINNIWGGVRVRTGDSNQIVVKISEVRSAPNQEMFDLSLRRITLNTAADADGVSILVGDSEARYDRKNLWNRMDQCRDCRVDYQFDVFVPPDSVVEVSTVMDGLVDVSGVTGIVSASNVNGSVSVDNIRDCESINSVNGRVNIEFSAAPVRDCEIETINGHITLNIPDNASLDVAADLFNGEIKSDFPVDALSLPATVEHIQDDGRSLYRIQKLSGVRIGAGGPIYSIASMNGDIRIRRN
ncbi:MAG: hypothetical protein ACR2QL_10425 [Woeseiaceae bacterium]